MKIKVRNRTDGSATVTGTVDPKLPGRIQWLRSNAVTPSARTTTRSNGSFTLRLKQPKPAATRSSFIPSGERAERLDLEHWSHPMKLSRSSPLGVAAAALALPAAASRTRASHDAAATSLRAGDDAAASPMP